MPGYLIYRVIKFLVMTLSQKWAYGLAVFLADISYLFLKSNRRALIANLGQVFPEKGPAVINLYARLTFRNFNKYLVDFFRFDKFNKEDIENEVTVHGLEHIQEGLKKGKGIIAVTAHLGNWELGGVIMALLGYKFNVVALSHKSSKVDSLFVRQRANKGMRVIPLGQAAPRCLKALKNNELVALLGDRNINERGISVPFFGKEASIPAGPAVLSVHTGASIVPGFLIRQARDKFSLILERPLGEIRLEDKEEELRRLTREMVKVIEVYIRRYPGQWFMFYPLWEGVK